MRFFFKCKFNIQAVVIANKSNNKTNHIKALLSLKRCPQIELNTIVIMFSSSYIYPQQDNFILVFQDKMPDLESIFWSRHSLNRNS